MFAVASRGLRRAAAAAAHSTRTMSNVGKLHPSTTTLLICDIQERFRPLIYNMETVISTSKFLTSVAYELEIPIVITQQYTKVFGPTITDAIFDPTLLDPQPPLSAVVKQQEEVTKEDEDGNTTTKSKRMIPIFDKKTFSMLTPDVSTHLSTLHPSSSSYILLGIEAHVCLQQTALDLIELGHTVHIITDGISSQNKYDRCIALQRLNKCNGIYLTTAQSIVFMLLHSADHPKFKIVSGLVKDHMLLKNEFATNECD
jgi:nicotinamidase-related amidase